MKTNKKTSRGVLRFLGMLLIGLVLGIFIGIGVGVGSEQLAGLYDRFAALLPGLSLVLMVAFGAAGLGAALVLLRLGKRQAAAAKLDAEELDEAAQAAQEEAVWRADHRYGLGMTLVSVEVVLNMILFGLWAQGGVAGGSLLAVGLLFLFAFLALALQGALVRATKQLYPEKQGSVLDPKFQKEWFDSCDEAERQMIWQCGYASMRALTRAMLVLFLVLVVLGLVADIGPAPMLVLGILWLVQLIAYQRTALRLGSKKPKTE